MIIDCIKCNKKFNVNPELIPKEGRTIQCGSCSHIWFFDNVKNTELVTEEKKSKKNDLSLHKKIVNEVDTEDQEQKESYLKPDKNNLSIPKKKTNFTFIKFLSYLLVLIISFVGLVIIADTFKVQLEIFFPNLELLLHNLFETLNDILLFIKDLN